MCTSQHCPDDFACVDVLLCPLKPRPLELTVWDHCEYKIILELHAQQTNQSDSFTHLELTVGAPVAVEEAGNKADGVGVAEAWLRVAVSSGDDPLTNTAAAGLEVGGVDVGVVSEVGVMVTMTCGGVTVSWVGVP